MNFTEDSIVTCIIMKLMIRGLSFDHIDRGLISTVGRDWQKLSVTQFSKPFEFFIFDVPQNDNEIDALIVELESCVYAKIA